MMIRNQNKRALAVALLALLLAQLSAEPLAAQDSAGAEPANIQVVPGGRHPDRHLDGDIAGRGGRRPDSPCPALEPGTRGVGQPDRPEGGRRQ